MKKSIILLLCAALTLGSVAFGTIAYLTDRQSIANTFTVGDVSIKVDEAEVDENGNIIDEDGDQLPDNRTEEDQNYHLIPGKTYVKDPTVTVMKGSEACYVRMLVTVNCTDALAEIAAYMKEKDPENFVYGLPQEFTVDFNAEQWLYHATAQNEDGSQTYEFRYYQPVSAQADADLALEPLFTGITVPGFVTKEQLASLENFTITVEGQAIQTAVFEADGDLTAEDAAWNAFDKQYTVEVEEEDGEDQETADQENADAETVTEEA